MEILRSMETGSVPRENAPYGAEGLEGIDYDKLLDKIVSSLPEKKRAHFRALIERYCQAGKQESLQLIMKLVRLMKDEKALETAIEKAPSAKKPALLKDQLRLREEIHEIREELEANEAREILEEIVGSLKEAKS